MKKIIDTSVFRRDLTHTQMLAYLFCQAECNFAGVVTRTHVSNTLGDEYIAVLTQLSRKKLIKVSPKTNEVLCWMALDNVTLTRESYCLKVQKDLLNVRSRTIQIHIFNKIKDLVPKEIKENTLNELNRQAASVTTIKSSPKAKKTKSPAQKAWEDKYARRSVNA